MISEKLQHLREEFKKILTEKEKIVNYSDETKLEDKASVQKEIDAARQRLFKEFYDTKRSKDITLNLDECLDLVIEMLKEVYEANGIQIDPKFYTMLDKKDEDIASNNLKAELSRGDVSVLVYITQLKNIFLGTKWGMSNKFAAMRKLNSESLERLVMIGHAANYLKTNNVAHSTWNELAAWMWISNIVANEVNSSTKGFLSLSGTSIDKLTIHYREIAKNIPLRLYVIRKTSLVNPEIQVKSNSMVVATDSGELNKHLNEALDHMEKSVTLEIKAQVLESSSPNADSMLDSISSGEYEDASSDSIVTLQPKEMSPASVKSSSMKSEFMHFTPQNAGVFTPIANLKAQNTLPYPEEKSDLLERFNLFKTFINLTESLSEVQQAFILNYKIQIVTELTKYKNAWFRPSGAPNFNITIPLANIKLTGRTHISEVDSLLLVMNTTDDPKEIVNSLFNTWSSIPADDTASDVKKITATFLNAMINLIRPTVMQNEKLLVNPPTLSQGVR